MREIGLILGVDDEYWVPEHVRAYLRGLGFVLPLEPMEEHIREWNEWMRSEGSFYDYYDMDAFGRSYEVHRRSVKPAMRVCTEWGSLLLNDKTICACDNKAVTEWMEDWIEDSGFLQAAQACLVRAFGLGTGAWALWVDGDAGKVRVRHYDARMIVPLTWDEDGCTECAFVTRVVYRGHAYDQLQMHVRGGLDGEIGSLGQKLGRQELTYRIITVVFDEHGNVMEPEGVCTEWDSGCPSPTFALIRPAVDNTRVDLSPYGQSVFADAIDTVQAVDLAFDALINEVDAGKMRIFVADVLVDQQTEGGKRVAIPFGKHDCTVFRKVMSTEDTIQEFAPPLRTDQQLTALRASLSLLGDLCGLGCKYIDFDTETGYLKTATEVSSDNSALMRNIAHHEHGLERALRQIFHAVICAARHMGEPLPDEGEVRVTFDDSIITDTAADKAQDMAEVAAGLMHDWEYRVKWFGEDEATARASMAEVDAPAGRSGQSEGGKPSVARDGSDGAASGS